MAYDVLSNPQKKALYDQRLAAKSETPRTEPPVPIAKQSHQPERTAVQVVHTSRHSAGIGGWLVAIIMGFFSGFMIYLLSALFFTGYGSAPSMPFVLLTFLGGWVASAYVMQKGAISISKVVSRGFLIGAAEWLLVIPAGMVLAGRLVASSANATASSGAAMAGAAIGGGIMAFLTGGVAIGMALVCLTGFAVSYFIGREMKPEIITATRKCPECAEMIQPDAKKCRFCGTPLTAQ